MAESNLLSFVLELSSWLVAISEWYLSRDMIAIPLSVPRLIINVSRSIVTLSK